MAICEKCWADAALESALSHRDQIDCYKELLEQRKGSPCSVEHQDAAPVAPENSTTVNVAFLTYLCAKESNGTGCLGETTAVAVRQLLKEFRAVRAELIQLTLALAKHRIYRCSEAMPQRYHTVVVAGGIAMWNGDQWISQTGDCSGRPIEWQVPWWMEIPELEAVS